MPKIDLAAVPKRQGSGYPAPFDAPCAERIRQRLGEAGGLTGFGVNLMRLPPGGWSSQRHWHSHEDEFVYLLEGELVLVEDAGETTLSAGDCAAFAKASGNGHHLVNRSRATAVYLEVGSRHPDDLTTCSDVDMMSAAADGRFTRKDGTPYPDTRGPPLRRLLQAIASAGDAEVLALLAASPSLAHAAAEEGATRASAADHFLGAIGHYVFAGDTALHIAAAAHRPAIVAELIRRGAAVAAANRMGAQPIHYAAEGSPGSAHGRPDAQAQTIGFLIAAGADPNAVERRQVTPLHRAVRTRCAGAVAALLRGGADPHRANGQGSTPMMLAIRSTGRGGSGSPAAKAQQAEIVALLKRFGTTQGA